MVERSAIVFNHSRRDDDRTVEVGQHPLGSGLGTVHSNNPEMLRPDRLDSERECRGVCQGGPAGDDERNDGSGKLHT